MSVISDSSERIVAVELTAHFPPRLLARTKTREKIA